MWNNRDSHDRNIHHFDNKIESENDSLEFKQTINIDRPSRRSLLIRNEETTSSTSSVRAGRTPTDQDRRLNPNSYGLFKYYSSPSWQIRDKYTNNNKYMASEMLEPFPSTPQQDIPGGKEDDRTRSKAFIMKAERRKGVKDMTRDIALFHELADTLDI